MQDMLTKSLKLRTRLPCPQSKRRFRGEDLLAFLLLFKMNTCIFQHLHSFQIKIFSLCKTLVSDVRNLTYSICIMSEACVFTQSSLLQKKHCI
jgi:hypothetical protein